MRTFCGGTVPKKIHLKDRCCIAFDLVWDFAMEGLYGSVGKTMLATNGSSNQNLKKYGRKERKGHECIQLLELLKVPTKDNTFVFYVLTGLK